MILNNFSKLCASLIEGPTNSQNSINFIDAGGYPARFNYDYQYARPKDGGINTFRMSERSYNLNQSSTWYIFLGKGTTQPTPSDYNFETEIDGVTYTSTNASLVREGTRLIYSAVITNTGSSSFSFSEVAIGNFHSGNPSTTILLTRDVISPVTVEPNKSKTVTVVIDFAAMATSVA